MEREIKFRVWDKINKCWMHPVWDITNPFPTNQHHVIQQFTGLKDKNGKEIYEGDVVYLLDHNCNVQVFKQRIGVYAYGYSLDYERGKIVGNIHENPELLEKAATDVS